MSLLRPLLALTLGTTLATAQAPEPPPGAPPTQPAATEQAPESATNPAPAQPAQAEPATPAVPAAPTTPSSPGARVVTPPGTATPDATPGATPGAIPRTPGLTPRTPGLTPRAPIGPGGAAPAANVAQRDPNVPLGETKIVEPIEKPTLNGAELAALYRKYTGRRVIVAAAAAAAEFSFVQDASPEDPLTYAEAAELLKKAAGIENFVFIPDEKDPKLDILTVSTRPPGIAYDVFNESDELPEGDGVISYVMTFKHIKPEAAAQAFTQIIGQFGTYGSIAPLNGAVVITENTSLIRRLIKLKDEIDKPDDITGTRFITVKYADVTELATTLNELLNSQQQAQRSSAVQRAPQPGAPPGTPQAPTGGGSSTTVDTPVQIVPEPRTNRVFAMGRPVDLLFVEGLVREFDIETSEKTFLRRKLRFLKVAEFLPVAENALTRAFSGTGEGSASGGAAGTSRTSAGSQGSTSSTGSSRTTGSSRSTGSSSRSSRSGSSSFGTGGSFGGGSNFGGSGIGGGGNALGEAIVNTAPESILVGRTLLVADNITNSIVVQGPPSGLEIVERLLDQIDVKADQIMISTVIGQLNLTNNRELGVDYLVNSGPDIVGRGGGGIGPILPIVPIVGSTTRTDRPFTSTDRGDLSAAAGLRVYGKVGDLNVYLRALQTNDDFTVLARPSIFTANSQKGIISSGERIAIPTNSNSFNNGGASTNIEYQDVVLKLEVIPLINDENTITLEIALLSDEVNGDQTIEGGGANGAPLTVPKITTREILTTVTIPNNETIVLGGLITARKGDGSSGIPILSSIPYLGKLFSSSTTKDERAELLVFIQPSIVSHRSSLDNVQMDTDARYRITDNIRRFADGPGVLPAPGDATAPATVEPAPGKSSATPAAPAAQPVAPAAPAAKPATQGTSKMRKSIRPAHRM